MVQQESRERLSIHRPSRKSLHGFQYLPVVTFIRPDCTAQADAIIGKLEKKINPPAGYTRYTGYLDVRAYGVKLNRRYEQVE
jgi:hypothetical protein